MEAFLFIVGLYVVSCIISIPIVKKRILFAKKMNIGRETEEKINEIKEVALNIYNTHVIPLDCKYNIKIEGENVKVSNNKVEVIFNGSKYMIIDEVFSETTAILIGGLYILSLFIFLSLFMVAVILSFK